MNRFIDQDLSYISINGCECNKCKYVYDNGLRCKAFPDGIPEEILSGLRSHRIPFPGDNGIMFKPREEK